MEKFNLILGEESSYLPGKMWTQYEVEVLDDKIVCTNKKDSSIQITIAYSEFKQAEFGIGNGNLWLQCELENGSLTFCSPRKSWKSEAGTCLVEKLNNTCGILDMRAYKQYTGPFFFIHMFK